MFLPHALQKGIFWENGFTETITRTSGRKSSDRTEICLLKEALVPAARRDVYRLGSEASTEIGAGCGSWALGELHAASGISHQRAAEYLISYTMIKQSSIPKWTLESKNTEKEYKRRWIHSPETLRNGHIIYQVKFLGKTEASKPKGIEVVKESIQKLTFSNQLKLSEGSKVPKVELSVSIHGVLIQSIKNKVKLYQYPLHQISYCADDKSDRKLFCFIAKDPNSDKHSSFVFASEKMAEEITMTVGQAFDLAYRHFLETSGKEIETQQRMMALRKKVHDLEIENRKLHEEIKLMEQRKGLITSTPEKANGVSGLKSSKNVTCPPPLEPPPPNNRHSGKNNKNLNLLEFKDQPKVEKSHDYFEDIKDLNNIANGNCTSNYDSFGMSEFSNFQPHDSLLKSPSDADRDIMEIRDAFQRGMSFGDGDLSTASCFDAIPK